LVERLRQFTLRHEPLHTIARFVLLCFLWSRNLIWWPLRWPAIRSYLKSHQARRLQIGAGPNRLEGWLNSDKFPNSCKLVFLNATRPFPFDNATFDYIFSEHLIEHLTYDQGQLMLRECFRVLKPGGKIRIATPDLEALIGLWSSKATDLQHRYIQWIVDRNLPEIGVYRKSFVINNAFRNWGHQFLYDRETLHMVLENAGFVEIARRDVGESDESVFRGIESHGVAIGDEDMNRFETMVLEASRPL
jgi:predicted SAM-dependent methyltransferase